MVDLFNPCYEMDIALLNSVYNTDQDSFSLHFSSCQAFDIKRLSLLASSNSLGEIGISHITVGYSTNNSQEKYVF
jgi:hypothetical protein